MQKYFLFFLKEKILLPKKFFSNEFLFSPQKTSTQNGNFYIKISQIGHIKFFSFHSLNSKLKVFFLLEVRINWSSKFQFEYKKVFCGIFTVSNQGSSFKMIGVLFPRYPMARKGLNPFTILNLTLPKTRIKLIIQMDLWR